MYPHTPINYMFLIKIHMDLLFEIDSIYRNLQTQSYYTIYVQIKFLVVSLFRQ